MAGLQMPPIVAQILGNVVPRVTQACQIPGCERFSLGLRCTQCTRPLCLSHGYVTPSTRPQTICCSCIVDRHPELFKEPG